MGSGKGFFITLEGGEGTGKTTLIGRLAQALKEEGLSVTVTREPGGSALGEAIRKMLLEKQGISIGAEAELLLFLAARAQHIREVIAPALARGDVVLCDRFNDSSIAYQGYARGLGMERVQELCRLTCGSVAPNLTLFLDVHPEIGLARTRRTAKENAPEGSVDRIESEELSFHQLVREGMLKLAQQEPQRVRVVDAGGTVDEVFNEAWRLVASALQMSV